MMRMTGVSVIIITRNTQPAQLKTCTNNQKMHDGSGNLDDHAARAERHGCQDEQWVERPGVNR